MKKIVAIVPSAGRGVRLHKRLDKPFVKIKSKPILAYTLEALQGSAYIDEIILVVSRKSIKRAEDLVKKYRIKKVKCIVPGGKERGLSVLNGLKRIDKDVDLVLIHDGARPFLDKNLIRSAIKNADRFGAACVAVPVKPTVKLAQKGSFKLTLNRKVLWEAQTPQVFKRDIIIRAYRNRKLAEKATDDSSLVEKMNQRVAIVKGNYRNIKITTKEDLLFAKQLLSYSA